MTSWLEYLNEGSASLKVQGLLSFTVGRKVLKDSQLSEEVVKADGIGCGWPMPQVIARGSTSAKAHRQYPIGYSWGKRV